MEEPAVSGRGHLQTVEERPRSHAEPGLGGAAPHRPQHRHAQRGVHQVGQHQGQRRVHGEQPGAQRPHAETERQTDRGAPGTGSGRRVVIWRPGQFGDPGRADGHGDTDGQPAEQPAHEQRREAPPVTDRQDETAQRGTDHAGRHHGASTVAVRQRRRDQQPRNQAEHVGAQQNVDVHPGVAGVLGVGDQQRGELVAAPTDAEDGDGHREPWPQATPVPFRNLLGLKGDGRHASTTR